MTYEYVAAEDEEVAAAFLRDKGWRVNVPACPHCHGWGQVPVWENTPTHRVMRVRPCPNECEPMTWHG